MQEEHYGIVIGVKVSADEPRTCFLATPFGRPFDDLSSVVVNAANRIQLQTNRTDQVRRGETFLQAIFEGIARARVVVAVCTPASDTRQVSRNVLYELGVAHALGKPTVILTTDRETLPVDLRTRHVDVYDPEGISSPAFGHWVELVLRKSIDRMAPPYLVNPDATGIKVAHGRHRMLLEPESWDSIRDLLTYGKAVHQEFQSLDTSHSNDLTLHVRNAVRSPRVPEHRTDLLKAWNNYDRHYQLQAHGNQIASIAAAESAAAKALEHLARVSANREKEQVREITGAYHQIQTLLPQYEQIRARVHDWITSGAFIEQEPIPRLEGEVVHLLNTTQRLLVIADKLLKALINFIL